MTYDQQRPKLCQFNAFVICDGSLVIICSKALWFVQPAPLACAHTLWQYFILLKAFHWYDDCSVNPQVGNT